MTVSLLTAGAGGGTEELACNAAADAASAAAFLATYEFHGRKTLFWATRVRVPSGGGKGADAGADMGMGAGGLAYDDAMLTTREQGRAGTAKLKNVVR